MIRSVLKLTPEDFKRLRSKMNQNTVKQKEAKEKFNLSHTERAMLIELEKLLSTFEWMTNLYMNTDTDKYSNMYPKADTDTHLCLVFYFLFFLFFF